MGSKKHKKESKKKKHRSRSRSPLEGEERERKRHKKHKDRKKDRSPDVEEVPVDSHLVDEGAKHSRSRSPASERDRRARELRVREEPPQSEKSKRTHERSASPAASGAGGAGSVAGGGAGDNLSVEETNRLRAKLGLKPLEVAEKPADDGKFKDDLGEFYHKPAANISEQKKAEKLREKLQQRKEKRKLEQKLQTTLLAEEGEDEDALSWVRKSRDLDKQKREAAKRAALLDELDAEFGVGALVAEEQRHSRDTSYDAPQLRGLRVAHQLDALGSERDVVLTLADKDVLAEDAEDVLVNVNLLDDEKYKKNIIERKKAKAGYQAYDDEAEAEAALGLGRPVLAKYDDEIHKDAADKKKGFRIGDEDALEAERFKEMMRRARVAGGVERRLESLQLPAPRLASDYLDHNELDAKFKKPKRKGKLRRKPKAEPIDVDAYDAAAAPLLTDDTDVSALSGAVQDEAETEPDAELQAALARARRLRLAPPAPAQPKVEEILSAVKEEPSAMETDEEPAMVLDATAEFCRTLGDIPTYGQAGNRDHAADILDFEREDVEKDIDEGGAGGAWSRVEPGADTPARPAAAPLGAEPALGAGVAGALRLALSKGYLDRGGAAPKPRPSQHHLLNARHYSIEDKAQGDDDKHGRRGGGYAGPLSEFREKAGFRPSVKLEYVDDEGRPLCPKEAFRYLSHKFHGKGPGKNKQEKRLKKVQQEGLMKKMSSTDTPLGTLQLLQDKQRETKSAFVVLSGAKKDAR